MAFRRAASVLKALPYRVHTMDELKCLPCLGDHSQRVIKVRLSVKSIRSQCERRIIHVSLPAILSGDLRRRHIERSGIDSTV